MATAEIVSIGTELLLGQIVDTNSQFLSRQLAELGIDCLNHQTVGDNRERIADCLSRALTRSDIVITTGGLGPTPDDITHETLSWMFKVDMVFDQSVMDNIEAKFKSLRIPMAESNRKQAQRPEGSDLLPNPRGTAPGIIWEISPDLLDKVALSGVNSPRYVLTFPGVPAEMKAMWADTARPYLESKFSDETIWSCELKHFGVGESNLAERVNDLLELSNPTVAPLAGDGECRLRVTAKGRTVAEARDLAGPVVAEIRKRSAHLCYGTDGDSLESVVGGLLRERGWTVSLAESCTGGLASKRLTDVAGSSAYVKLNVVTYANEAKNKVLGVDERILETNGAVSAECAKAMASGIRALANSDMGVSITGIAGPDGGTEEKPVGLVYLGLDADEFEAVKEIRLPAIFGRSGIRHRTASVALNMMRLFLLDRKLLEMWCRR